MPDMKNVHRYLYNSFIAPRIKNDFVRDLKTERIIGGDLTYNFNTPWVMGRLTGYYTRFQNQVEMDAFIMIAKHVSLIFL